MAQQRYFNPAFVVNKFHATDYNVAPDITFTSTITQESATSAIFLWNQTGTVRVFYSFNGTTDHGILGLNTEPISGKVMDNRQEKAIWFRQAPATAAQTIMVEAWA